MVSFDEYLFLFWWSLIYSISLILGTFCVLLKKALPILYLFLLEALWVQLLHLDRWFMLIYLYVYVR